MSKADYYDLLGVSRDASLDDIKKSYRKLAKQCHPDTNPDDDQLHRKFQEITEAYEVLRDDQKRAAYDRYGHDAFEQPGGGAGGGGFRGGFGGFGGFGDIFDEIFGEVTGQRRGRQPNNRGADLRYNMTIDLEDAFRGRKTTIRVPTAVVCQSCHGSGSEGGSVPGTCDTCQGRGRVRAQQGFFTIERTCPSCHGAGQVIKNPCHDCSGSGRVAEEKSLSVNIPEGVEDGTRIRLAGEGEAGMRGGPAGDLYIFLTIKPHPLFSRDGPHLMCTVPITMVNAALGGEVEVPSVDGSRARINVPAGTQTGTQFRLRGKGMSILRTKNRGDLFVKVTVETPVNLTSEQRDLLEKFASASGNRADHHPESAGFFQKVKEFFEDLKD